MTGIFQALIALLFKLEPQVDASLAHDLPYSKHDRATVLAIDDDPAYLNTLNHLLTGVGYNVLTASSGAKALNVLSFAPYPIDVILLDYRMPQLDGEQTLQHIRKFDPAAKIIGLTSSKLSELPASFVNGLNRLVEKTCPVAMLTDLVGTLAALKLTNSPRPQV
jgi:CheY-like chemotaxis protein